MNDESFDYRKSLMALVMAMLCMAMGVGFIGPLLPVYAERLGASGTWIGMIFGANPFVRAVLMIVFGSMSDYEGKKKIMAAGLMGYLVLSLGFVFATSVYYLLILRILQGVFSAMISPVARAYAGELSPAKEEGSVMGMINTGFFAGFAAGPIIGGLFADHFGFNVPFYAMAFLNFLAFSCVILFVPEQKVATAGEGKRESPLVTVIESVKLMRRRIVRGMVMIRSSVGIGHGIFSSLLPLFGELFVGATSAQIGFAVSSRGLVSALLQKKAGNLADKYNRKKLAIFTSLLAPLGFLMVPFSQIPIHLILVSSFIGLSYGISVPSAEAIAVEVGREYNMGRMMGLKEMFRSLAMGVGSVIGGVSLDLLGPFGAHVAAAVMSSVGLFVALWNLRNYEQFSKAPAFVADDD